MVARSSQPFWAVLIEVAQQVRTEEVLRLRPAVFTFLQLEVEDLEKRERE